MTTPHQHTRPHLLDAASRMPPEVRPEDPALLTDLMDRETYDSLEIARLFESLNHTKTRLGAATLLMSLGNPLDQLETLKARQAALKGLRENPALKNQLSGLIKELARLEPSLYDFLFGTFLGLIGSKAKALEVEGYGYDATIRGTLFLRTAVEGARAIEPTGYQTLDELLERLRQFETTRAYRLARGPVYRAEHGIITREEKRPWTPCIRFSPSLFKPVGLLSFGLMILLIGQFVPLLLDLVVGLAGAFWIFLFPLAFLYVPIVGGFDRDGCIYPLRDAIRKSPEVHALLDDIGALDELLTLADLPDLMPHPTTLPELIDAPAHQLQAKGLCNPLLAQENPDYVGNDINLESHRLSLITGPNSGGKTAFCKTLAQSQLLAQIGSYIVAESARMSLADRIFHQAPEISQLADGEGRFGTELRRTKAIFLKATPRSLVIMDELSEGTTHEEKIEISRNILDGFAQKGNSTLLITHNHALVDQYQPRKDALCLMVEFDQGEPTYRLIEGISRISHADRVAARIGFSKADIDQHLAATRPS